MSGSKGRDEGQEGAQGHVGNGATLAASLESIQAAAQRIAPFAHVTPVLTSTLVDSRTPAGLHLVFKLEIFQKSGSFKFRGACNAVLSLSEEAAARGVVTHSSGNHAAAAALAAKVRGVPAHIVVPHTTPKVKVAAVEAYGGLVTVCEPTIDAREAACAQLQVSTGGAAFIPPYNHPDVISGQGTIALELLKQAPDLDAIIVPVSGGGMISGVAVAAKALRPGIKIVAAEPCGAQGDAADVAASLAQGRLVHELPKPDTIADGLQGRLGDLTWAIVRAHVDEVVVVSESEITAAMRLVYGALKVVVEPSGAVGVAAALSPQWLTKPQLAGVKRVGVILCGGNVDLDPLWASLP